MDELDGKGLGRLQRVADPREVWVSEAGDFTPWLAENLDVLAEELGMALTLVGTEVPVGDFRLDIQAENPEGRTVIIENQLDRTDHGHLGQLLVYASGLEAAAVVWVAPRFRDEFRRALDWLNERTDMGVDFFGVEVSVMQIGAAGPRAPFFDVVARPNGWQKEVKGAAAGRSGVGMVSPLNAQRQDFFIDVLTDVVAQRPGIRLPSRGRENWINYASGPFGTWGIGVVADGRLRIEAYLDSGDGLCNEQLFDELSEHEPRWSTEIGITLDWDRLDGRRACRISAYHHPVDFEDAQARQRARQWTTTTAIKMYDALNKPLRRRAGELRNPTSAKSHISTSQPMA